MDWKTLLFTFVGRVNRGKYWLGVLIVLLAYVAAAIIFGVFYGIAGTVGAIIGGIALLAAFVVGVWGSVAIGIKRLHDREKSGWWLLLFYLVPGFMSGIGQAMDNIMGAIISLAGFGISIWGLVELGCLKGTTGPNQYGPDPLPAEPD